jgi:hypothetical protein
MRSTGKVHARLTADEVVEYAAHCKTEAGSVWFLFVMDDSVTEACLPTGASQLELHHVRDAMQYFPNGTEMIALLDVCYAQDLYHGDQGYGSVSHRLITHSFIIKLRHTAHSLGRL